MQGAPGGVAGLGTANELQEVSRRPGVYRLQDPDMAVCFGSAPLPASRSAASLKGQDFLSSRA